MLRFSYHKAHECCKSFFFKTMWVAKWWHFIKNHTYKTVNVKHLIPTDSAILKPLHSVSVEISSCII